MDVRNVWDDHEGGKVGLCLGKSLKDVECEKVIIMEVRSGINRLEGYDMRIGDNDDKKGKVEGTHIAMNTFRTRVGLPLTKA